MIEVSDQVYTTWRAGDGPALMPAISWEDWELLKQLSDCSDAAEDLMAAELLHRALTQVREDLGGTHVREDLS